MKKAILTSLALAVALSAAPARAGGTQIAINGLGTLKCNFVTKHDWMVFGEFNWVAGYMTGMASFAPATNGIMDILPGGKPADLVKMVFKQCLHDPNGSLYDAASKIANRLLNIQAPSNSNAGDNADDGDREPGQAF